MVDLHHHLLPGLDDGSTSLETSVAMARLAVEDGITHVVCTPHANGYFSYDPGVNEAKLAELQAALLAENIALTLGLGCDFHLSYNNIEDAKAQPKRYAINAGAYLLVELPNYSFPAGLSEVFYELQLVGLTPILTHPERNPTLQEDPKRMEDWLRAGVLVQVTGDSVRGSMGKHAEKMAHQLLANRWVHFLASDAHNVTSRPPRLSEARALVAKKYGAEYATLLTETNPAAVFENRALPEQEELRGLYADQESKGMLGRLLDRLNER